MKSKEQFASENDILSVADIYTLSEFIDILDEGGINRNDGEGYFHDGNNETGISVWDDNLTWDNVKDYPYICWYNKWWKPSFKSKV